MTRPIRTACVRHVERRCPHLIPAFLFVLKNGFIQWSLKTVSLQLFHIQILCLSLQLAGLRTTVAVNTFLLYVTVELTTALGPLPVLDPFCEVLLTSLWRMANFTKITAQHIGLSHCHLRTHLCSITIGFAFALANFAGEDCSSSRLCCQCCPS